MGERVDLHIGGYHLTEGIGSGGMGSVFRATVEAQGKPLPVGSTVAVKLLHPHLRSVKEFARRFHREAKLAAKIDHPNVVRVFDEGIEVDQHQHKHHYIAMEYAEGLKLTDLVGGRPLSPQQTIEIMNQVCEALKAASRVENPDTPGEVHCVVHRDIKPENIIIQPRDPKQYETMTQTGDVTALANIHVKLLDFGLAKDSKSLSSIISQTGQSLGTPAYMSPEQCAGDASIDQRTDIYSLGVVAYHMITGTTPFNGPTTVAYAKQHAEEVPPDILTRNALCPRNLADCIYRCLAKSPADRYRTPEELQRDLARVAAGKPVAKVHRFKKAGGIGLKKVAAIAGTGCVAALMAVAGYLYYSADRAKAALADATQRADVAVAAGDYAGAKHTLEGAIAAMPSRADKAQLIEPAHARLKEIAARAAEQEAARAKAAEAEARQKHEQDAVTAVAKVKAGIAAGQYQQAVSDANGGLKDFADTPSAKEFSDLVASATEKLKAEQAAQAASERADREREAAESKTRHERFIKYRDEGDEHFRALRYADARLSYEKALSEEDASDVRSRLQTCMDRTTRQRIAVVDFKVIGDVGINQAGQAVAEQLLPKFGERFQVVERSQLEAILKEHDLTMAQIVDNPAILAGKKIEGVRYLVLGSVSKLGNISISARLVDIVRNPGDHVQNAEVSAEDARGLQNALGELAKMLQMTSEEKKAYLGARPAAPAVTALAIRAEAEPNSGPAPLSSQMICRDAPSGSTVRWLHNSKEVATGERAGLTFKNPGAYELVCEVTASDGRKAIASVQVQIDRPAASAKTLSLDCGGGVTMELVLVPAGEFMMGSPDKEAQRTSDEGPQHSVRISRAFYMGKYEVTQAQWEAVMGSNPSRFKGDGKLPVEFVSWDDCQEFCRKLSSGTGRTIRLPTEAQWEYACRAGTTTPFSFGQTISTDQANYDGNSTYGNGGKGEYRQKTVPVGSFPPNAWGLHDMHGNIWEWCQDWYGSYEGSAQVEPAGPSSGPGRVLRGGSWYNNPWNCRSASRDGNTPDYRFDGNGLRVVVVGAASGTP